MLTTDKLVGVRIIIKPIMIIRNRLYLFTATIFLITITYILYDYIINIYGGGYCYIVIKGVSLQ